MKRVKYLLIFFIAMLLLSGLSAIPIQQELSFLLKFFPIDSRMHQWLWKVLLAYESTTENHPFLLYGYDWLAFAHFAFAILFIGPVKDPVQNKWVIQFGLITCVLIIPTAFIGGSIRGIPIWWQLIDCSFGILGFAILWICYTSINKYIYTQQHSL